MLNYKNKRQSYTEIKGEGEGGDVKLKNSLRRCGAPFCFRLIYLCLQSWRVMGRGMREEGRGKRLEGWQLLLAGRWGL